MRVNLHFMTIAFILLANSSFGWSVPKSQIVYIKYPKTPFRSEVSPQGKVQLLYTGQEVLWLGADEKQPQWQKVEYSGQQGFVALSNLSRRQPSKEFSVSESGVVQSQDTQAFARSSAAAKALGDGALNYAEAKNQGEVAAQLFTAEVISKKIDKPEELNAHAKRAGLNQHQGERE